MNRFMCKLTGGHLYSDTNIQTELIPDDINKVILRNRCIKCGKEYFCIIDIRDEINDHISFLEKGETVL